MISVIVCSQDPSRHLHRDHVGSTIDCPHEYISIDNSKNEYGICAAYNNGVQKAMGDICVFVHEDVFVITTGWGTILKNTFNHDPAIGCIGVAGAQYLFRDKPFWAEAGRPFIKGRVVHDTPEDNRCVLSVFSEEEKDEEVIVVDGLFFAIRKELFKTIQFDEKTFDRFHFYDLDICMQVRKSHKVMVTSSILVKHFSGGTFKEEWSRYGKKFIDKYYNDLPVSCTDKTPDLTSPIPSEHYLLEKTLSPESFNYLKNLGNDLPLPQPATTTSKPDAPIIAVTGMHRSGTSCVAGLLSKCGFSLGPQQTLLNENKPKFDNQKGHFENLNVVLINETILKAAQGSWHDPPSQDTIRSTGEVVKNNLNQFSQTFTGAVIKDPRLSITLELWKKYCPRLQYVVICFRHPLGVAHSLKKRNDLSLESGLELWYEYNTRLIDAIEHMPVVVVDYDNFNDHLEDDFFDVLRALHSSTSRDEMVKNIDGFYDTGLNHNPFTEKETAALPDTIKQLYGTLKSQSIAVRMGRN